MQVGDQLEAAHARGPHQCPGLLEAAGQWPSLSGVGVVPSVAGPDGAPGDGDVPPSFGQCHRGGLADAPRGPGDQGSPLVASPGHLRCLADLPVPKVGPRTGLPRFLRLLPKNFAAAEVEQCRPRARSAGSCSPGPEGRPHAGGMAGQGHPPVRGPPAACARPTPTGPALPSPPRRLPSVGLTGD